MLVTPAFVPRQGPATVPRSPPMDDAILDDDGAEVRITSHGRPAPTPLLYGLPFALEGTCRDCPFPLTALSISGFDDANFSKFHSLQATVDGS
jgi:hypothetical protein